MKKIMTEREIYIENIRRDNEERNVHYPKMLLDFKSLSLKRINIMRKDHNNHEHKGIKKTKYYLIGYNGRWVISQPQRDFHNEGWKFDVGLYQTGLTNIDILFEIKNMPKYKEKPLRRLEIPDYDGEE